MDTFAVETNDHKITSSKPFKKEILSFENGLKLGMTALLNMEKQSFVVATDSISRQWKYFSSFLSFLFEFHIACCYTYHYYLLILFYFLSSFTKYFMPLVFTEMMQKKAFVLPPSLFWACLMKCKWVIVYK